MAVSKVKPFDVAINMLLILFPVLLMAIMGYVIFSSEISTLNKVIGSGISVFGIVGTIMVAIFKNELDKAESSEEKNKIMEFLIRIFKNFKKP